MKNTNFKFNLLFVHIAFFSFLVSSGFANPFPDLPHNAGAKHMLNQSTVLGGLSKSQFKTGILYNIGPVHSRNIAEAHDGSRFLTPPNHRQWRQTIFELEKNKLHPDTLPDYLDHIRSAEEYKWQFSDDNRQPIMIADVSFEWFDKPLSEYQELEQVSENSYQMKKGLAKLPTRENRFFSASLLNESVNSRLVTFALEKDFIFTNKEDRIIEIDLVFENLSFNIPVGTTITLDLGEEPGIKKFRLIATHESGKKSRAFLITDLKKLPNGKWSNTVIRNGRPEFVYTRLPNTQFKVPASIKQVLGGE